MVENRLNTLVTDLIAEEEMNVSTFGMFLRLEAKALRELIATYPLTPRSRRNSKSE